MRGSSLARVVAFAGVVILTGFGLGRPVQAEMYRWIDRQGNIHLTQMPPPPGQATEVKRIGDSTSGEAAPRPAAVRKTLSGFMYRGDEPSRRVALEKVGVRIGDPYAPPVQIGSSCGRGQTARDAYHWAERISWSSGFHGRLDQLGYETPKSVALSFSNEAPRPIDVSVIGLVTDLKVQGCTNVRHLRVEWRVFDNLLRKVVYETTTIGSDDVNASTRAAESMLEAFVSAADELFSDAEFQRIVATPENGTETPASAEALESDGEPLAIPLRFSATGSSFRDQIEAIKTASVTVRTASGHGSGFLVSSRGHVLTNDHVVRGSDRVLVLIGTQEIEAQVIRSNAMRDVAILKLATTPDVAPLQLAQERPVEGDTLYVVGTPLDERLHHTVTRGILSAVRELDHLSYYQTDAAINPGNSGGPVFDAFGRVVGITVSGAFSKDGASLNINLLIPIHDALRGLRIEPGD